MYLCTTDIQSLQIWTFRMIPKSKDIISEKVSWKNQNQPNMCTKAIKYLGKQPGFYKLNQTASANTRNQPILLHFLIWLANPAWIYLPFEFSLIVRKLAIYNTVQFNVLWDCFNSVLCRVVFTFVCVRTLHNLLEFYLLKSIGTQHIFLVWILIFLNIVCWVHGHILFDGFLNFPCYDLNTADF